MIDCRTAKVLPDKTVSSARETTIKDCIGVISSAEGGKEREEGEGQGGDKWSEKKEEKIGCWLEVD